MKDSPEFPIENRKSQIANKREAVYSKVDGLSFINELAVLL